MVGNRAANRADSSTGAASTTTNRVGIANTGHLLWRSFARCSFRPSTRPLPLDSYATSRLSPNPGANRQFFASRGERVMP